VWVFLASFFRLGENLPGVGGGKDWPGGGGGGGGFLGGGEGKKEELILLT